MKIIAYQPISHRGWYSIHAHYKGIKVTRGPRFDRLDLIVYNCIIMNAWYNVLLGLLTDIPDFNYQLIEYIKALFDESLQNKALDNYKELIFDFRSKIADNKYELTRNSILDVTIQLYEWGVKLDKLVWVKNLVKEGHKDKKVLWRCWNDEELNYLRENGALGIQEFENRIVDDKGNIIPYSDDEHVRYYKNGYYEV